MNAISRKEKPQVAVNKRTAASNLLFCLQRARSTAARLEAIPAVHRSIARRLERNLSLLAALGAGRIEQLLRAAASAAVSTTAATPVATATTTAAKAASAAATTAIAATTTATAAATGGLACGAARGASLRLMSEPALGIPLLVVR